MGFLFGSSDTNYLGFWVNGYAEANCKPYDISIPSFSLFLFTALCLIVFYKIMPNSLLYISNYSIHFSCFHTMCLPPRIRIYALLFILIFPTCTFHFNHDYNQLIPFKSLYFTISLILFFHMLGLGHEMIISPQITSYIDHHFNLDGWDSLLVGPLKFNSN